MYLRMNAHDTISYCIMSQVGAFNCTLVYTAGIADIVSENIGRSIDSESILEVHLKDILILVVKHIER